MTHMKIIYHGFSYRIICREGRHDWLRIRFKVPPRDQRFASKPCDCRDLESMGVRLPFNGKLKVTLRYFAPGVTA